MKKTLIAVYVMAILNAAAHSTSNTAATNSNPTLEFEHNRFENIVIEPYRRPTADDLAKSAKLLADLNVGAAKNDAQLSQYLNVPVDVIRESKVEQSFDKDYLKGNREQQAKVQQATANNPTFDLAAALDKTIAGYESSLFGVMLNASTIAQLKAMRELAASNGVNTTRFDSNQWNVSDADPLNNETSAAMEEALSNINQMLNDPAYSAAERQELETARNQMIQDITTLRAAEAAAANANQDSDGSIKKVIGTSLPLNQPTLPDTDNLTKDEKIKLLGQLEVQIKNLKENPSFGDAELLLFKELVAQRDALMAELSPDDTQANTVNAQTESTLSTPNAESSATSTNDTANDAAVKTTESSTTPSATQNRPLLY